MFIRLRKETKNEKAISEASGSQPPATVAQRIQATRIMGGIGYALFAGFLLTIGYAIFANSKTTRVDGTVISRSSVTSTSYNGSISGNKSTEYWYEFQYSHVDGELHTGETFGWGTKTEYSTGDVVSIGYYPDDPGKVRVRNWFAGWRYQFVLLCLGFVLIAYSIKAVAIIKQEDVDAKSDQQT